MATKRTYHYQGREVQGQPVEFEAKSEAWNQYILEDGSSVKMKVVLLEVARLDEYNERNEPIYILTAQQIMGTTVAEEVKKKA